MYLAELLSFIGGPDIDEETAGETNVDLMLLLDDAELAKIMQAQSFNGVDLSIAFGDPIAKFGLIFVLNENFETRLEMFQEALAPYITAKID